MSPQRRAAFDGLLRAKFLEAPEWGTLGEASSRLLDQAAVAMRLDAGGVLFREAEECKGVYFVSSGLFSLHKTSLHGSATLVKLARTGDTLGYRPLMAHQRHRAQATAIGPSTVVFLDRASVLNLMLQETSLAVRFLERAARELGDAEERFHRTVSLSVRERLVLLLRGMVVEYGHRARPGWSGVRLPISQNDLAAMLGVRRESVSRVMHDLKEEGILTGKGRNIELLDTWIADQEQSLGPTESATLAPTLR